jgi:eukaryotic-like serine/threonine-protein kinase
MEDLVGKIIDNTYRIDKLLGQGGMGAVYKGHDVSLDRDVALKIMHAHISTQQGFRDRFLQEARAAAALEHPGIVRVHTFSHNPELLYIVMAFVPGQNLRDWLYLLAQKSMILSLPESLAIVESVAGALAYAHLRGVFHRDIKPGNIILRPLEPGQTNEMGLSYQPVVTDFGLAKLAEGGVQSVTGMAMGTPAYMAPEQCEGRDVDGRADIYALGIVLYELVTGKVPFDVKTLTEALRAHTQEPPPPPRAIAPDLPSQIETIILKALAKAPGDRYPKASDMVTELHAARLALPHEESPLVNKEQGRASLVTMMAQEVPGPVPEAQAWPTPPAEIPAGGRVLVLGPGGQTTAIPLGERQRLTIGREEGNDIVLPDPKSSRRHAQIGVTAPGKFAITDLGSTNGTLMGNNRLLPGVPENWPAAQTVRIGDHWLRVEVVQAAQPQIQPGPEASYVASPKPATSGKPLASPQPTPSGQPIQVALETEQLAVRAGESVALNVRILNRQQQVDHFIPLVEGLPDEWVTRPSAALRLVPGDAGNLTLRLSPPQAPTSLAGEHPFTVKVVSRVDPQQSAQASGSLTIQPYHGLKVELIPSVFTNAGRGNLRLTNTGNTPERLALSGTDPSGLLNVLPPSAQVTLAPGQQQDLSYPVSARQRRPLMGTPQTYPFVVSATTARGEVTSTQGTLNVKPILPAWVLPLFTTALLVACALGFFAYTQMQKDKAEKATATLVALNAITAEAQATGQGIATQTGVAASAQQTATTKAEAIADAQTATIYFKGETATAKYETGTAQAQGTAAAKAETSTAAAQGTAYALTQTAAATKKVTPPPSPTPAPTHTNTPVPTPGPSPTPRPFVRAPASIARLNANVFILLHGYKVKVQTGNVASGGTSAQVKIQIVGSGGNTDWIVLHNDGQTNFQQNQLDTFDISGADVGTITKVCVQQDNTGSSPDWYVAWVQVDGGSGVLTFQFNRWIATGKSDGQLQACQTPS